MLRFPLPALGASGFGLELISARAGALCAIVVSSASQSLPIGGGCTLYLAGTELPFFRTTDQAGYVRVPFALPLDPSLRGFHVYAQGFVVDPLGAFAGLAFTGGLELRVGD